MGSPPLDAMLEVLYEEDFFAAWETRPFFLRNRRFVPCQNGIKLILYIESSIALVGTRRREFLQGGYSQKAGEGPPSFLSSNSLSKK